MCEDESLFVLPVGATSDTYTLSLHDALPIFAQLARARRLRLELARFAQRDRGGAVQLRSEEHTSELQSRGHLVCRLLLEKKKSVEKALGARKRDIRFQFLAEALVNNFVRRGF